MKITNIGCGSAFSKELYNSCFMLEEDGRKLFIDLGQQIIPFALMNLGLSEKDIDDVYISHLHSDHIGSLEALGFLRFDWQNHADLWHKRTPQNKAPRLFIKKGLAKKLWEESLRGGMKNSIQWFDATLESFFEVIEIDTIHFEWQGWTCTPIQQVHIAAFADISPSYGLMMEKEGHKTIYFTTDSQHVTPRQMTDFYAKCDLIFQDCETIGCNFKFQEREINTANLAEQQGIEIWEVYKFGSGVHANYAELAGYDSANAYKLNPEVKSKIWLTHYGDHVKHNKDFFGNDLDWKKQVNKDGFAGLVEVGMTWDTKK